MLVVGVFRSLQFLSEAKVTDAKICEAYFTVVLLDYEDDLGISANLAKSHYKLCNVRFSHISTRNHIGAQSLYSALEASPTRVPNWTRRRRWTS
jgi:hypothetical protein